MRRLPVTSPLHAAVATSAMPVLAPQLRALARRMRVDTDAAIAEGWLAAHDRARRGLDPADHAGWILAAARRALRREWLGAATDTSRSETCDDNTFDAPWSILPEDPLTVLTNSLASISSPQQVSLDATRTKALAMVIRARASRSPRTKRYWRARARAVLASIGVTDTP